MKMNGIKQVYFSKLDNGAVVWHAEGTSDTGEHIHATGDTSYDAEYNFGLKNWVLLKKKKKLRGKQKTD